LPQADIIDRKLIAGFRQRAQKRARGGEDFLLLHALEDISERMSTVGRNFERGVLIAPMAAKYASALKQNVKLGLLDHLDAFQGPGETLPHPAAKYDLVLSVLALQEVNDVPGMLIQMRQLLRPDGLMLATMLGGETLTELRTSLTQAESEIYGGASPRVLPFVDVRTAGALLQRTGYALPVTDAEMLTVRYDDLWAVMRDLRAMGAQNALTARSRKPLSKRFFQRAAEIYADEFSDADGRVRATFSLISLSGWMPHKSQQKPLKPGSAKVSLAAILEKR
jgi:SAM-dependent methyltransferase